jgi:hypothetical protein
VECWDEAQVLVVAHDTAASPALLEAVRERAERSPAARFHLLVPSSPEVNWHLVHRSRYQKLTQAEEVALLALPLIEDAAGDSVDCSMSIRQDPMDAIEEALSRWHFDEIILSAPTRRFARRLHVDLPRRVAHLGLPVTPVTPPHGHRGRARSGSAPAPPPTASR